MEEKKTWSTPEIYTLGVSSTELNDAGPDLDCMIIDGKDLHGLS
jgi:hypothetical protein